jgi:FAD/FMN-containing dehydrogenase
MLTEDQKKQLRSMGRAVFADEPDFESFHPYLTDRSRESGAAEGVLFPESTAQVQEIVRLCRTERIPLVPSGGRTGYAGGAVARGGLVLSLEKMDKLLAVHPEVPALHVQAGMITENVQKEAESLGLFFPVDFAAAGSSQVGGNIATNAGGIRVIRYGMMRQHVLGLTVVTGAGETLRLMSSVRKDNTGPDLKQWFIGSEGIFGIITEAMLSLERPMREPVTALTGLSTFEDVIDLLRRARREVELSAFECFDRRSLEAVRAHTGLPEPLEQSPWYALLEWESQEKEPDLGTAPIAVARSSAHAEQMWKYREAVSESISMHTLYKNDISIPPQAMSQYIQTMKEEAASAGLDIAIFGHAGDGNLHVNLICPHGLSADEFQLRARAFTAKSYDYIQAAQGSISAEHGIGLLKRADFLEHATDEKIELLRKMKAVLDPDGIMNPGKVI